MNAAMGTTTERFSVNGKAYFLKSFQNKEQAAYEVGLRQRIICSEFVEILAYSVSSSGSQILMADAGSSWWDRDGYSCLEHGPIMSAMFAYTCMWSILCSMVEAELAGVVHRDLKPDNIVGRLWTIIDLSSAVYVGTFAERVKQGLVHRAVGTWGYMAPELQRFMQQGGSDEQAVAMTTSKLDVYSYGAIGYELMTGCLPPAAGRGPLTFPPVSCPDWPHQKEAQAFITSCLQADPEQRPTFAQLKQQAAGWLQPFEVQVRLALRDPEHPILMARGSIAEFYASKKVQAKLRRWAKKADKAASLPLPLPSRDDTSLMQRVVNVFRKQLPARMQQQQAVQAEVKAAVQPAAQPAAQLLAPCTTRSASSSSSGCSIELAVGSSADAVCVIQVTQPAVAKAAMGRLASWGSSFRQRCAARLQRMDTFRTQDITLRRRSRRVAGAAC